jgi:dipeptidyl aminopeptidase/acylaminoacyl peptidase
MRSLTTTSGQFPAQQRALTLRARPATAMAWLLALVLLGFVVLAAPAQAAFPGANGRMAFTSIDWAWSETTDVWSMNADGSAAVNLTNHPAEDFAPAFSPDGSRIAFTSDRDGNQEIYVINADGSGQTRLTTAAGQDTNPAFSADGSKIAFTSDRDGNQELYLIGADGSGETRLTTSAANEGGAAFSADGTRLAYSSDQDGDQEIYVMAPNGSNPTRLTDNAVNDFDPAFSPDGLRLAFTSNRDGGIQQVYVMSPDGSGQVNVTNDAATRHSYQPAFSPDGSRIALATFAYCPPGHLCGQTLNGGIRVRNGDGSGEMRLDEDGGSNSQPDWGVADPGTPPPPPPPPPPPADTTPPETTIGSGPTGATNDTTPTFAFAGTDNASPGDALRYAFAVDGGPWSPYAADMLVTLGAGSGLSQGAHTFSVKARDEAGNQDPTPATTSFFVDSVAPTSTVTINGGATRVRTRAVTLTLTATDPSPGSGVTAMRISNSASGLSAAPWQPYAATGSWTLTSGSGTKTVYVQYRDAAANTSTVAQDTITYKP